MLLFPDTLWLRCGFSMHPTHSSFLSNKSRDPFPAIINIHRSFANHHHSSNRETLGNNKNCKSHLRFLLVCFTLLISCKAKFGLPRLTNSASVQLKSCGSRPKLILFLCTAASDMLIRPAKWSHTAWLFQSIWISVTTKLPTVRGLGNGRLLISSTLNYYKHSYSHPEAAWTERQSPCALWYLNIHGLKQTECRNTFCVWALEAKDVTR